jgi:hypothetical protein
MSRQSDQNSTNKNITCISSYRFNMNPYGYEDLQQIANFNINNDDESNNKNEGIFKKYKYT